MKKIISKKSTTKKPVAKKPMMKSGATKKTLRKAQAGMATTPPAAPAKPKVSPYSYMVGNPIKGEKLREVDQSEFLRTTGPKTRFERDSMGKPVVPMSGGKQFTDYTPMGTKKKGGATKMKKGATKLRKAQNGTQVQTKNTAPKKSVASQLGIFGGAGLGIAGAAFGKNIVRAMQAAKERRLEKKKEKAEAKKVTGTKTKLAKNKK